MAVDAGCLGERKLRRAGSRVPWLSKKLGLAVQQMQPIMLVGDRGCADVAAFRPALFADQAGIATT